MILTPACGAKKCLIFQHSFLIGQRKRMQQLHFGRSREVFKTFPFADAELIEVDDEVVVNTSRAPGTISLLFCML